VTLARQRLGAPAGPAPEYGRRWLALAVLLTGGFMILLDSTIVNVAAPAIQVDLAASYSVVEWVVGGYALAYGLLLIPGGRLGDRFGYRRMFVLGLAGFTAASVLCGTADTPGQLVAWRVVQGALAGIMNPQILAVIQVAFPVRERARAYSVYGAVNGLAVAAGPLLGGLLIQADAGGLGWRPIFLLNLPIGVLALLAARLVPPARGRPDRLDLVGTVLAGATMLLVTFPLVEGREAGWPGWAWVCLGLAVPAAVLFGWWEARRTGRGRAPLVDVRLFRNRTFAAGVGLGLSFFTGFVGLIFVLSLHLQLGLGRSALDTGLILMPFAAGVFCGAAVSHRLSARLGRNVLLLGSGLTIAGTVGIVATLRLAGATVTGPQLLPALLAAGVGSGMVIAPSVDIVLASVPRQDAGSASGVVNTAQRLGNALGVAIVGVALFGALGSHAAASAGAAVPGLRTDLVSAGQGSTAVDAGAKRFADCYVTRSTATDPTVTPPGCPRPRPGDPVATGYARAADRAQADNFTRATQIAAAWALVALVGTFLLAWLIPPPRRAEAAPDLATAAPARSQQE
jgi:EmrB/QacA subfamily drug resistance transporter